MRLPLFLGLCLAAMSALAHDLRVFAYVEDTTVNVEARFSSGRLPVEGEIRVFDASETLTGTYQVDPDGLTSFPLPDNVRDSGLMIEVVVGEGHSDYWMLTPEDIAKGQQKP